MRETLALTLALCAGAGCAGNKDNLRAAAPLPPRAVVCATTTPTINEREPSPVLEFQDDAHALMGQPASPRHETEVEALRSLAAAVRSLREASVESGDRIDAIASFIEQSGADSDMHQVAVKDALFEAERALEAAHRANSNIPCFEERIVAARNAIAAIDEETPFLQQRHRVDNAFTLVADAFPVGSTRMVVAGVQSPYVTKHDVRVNTWGWNWGNRAPSGEQVCGGQPIGVERRRTAGDIAATIGSLGWYRPSHVRITCSARSDAAR